MYVYIRMKLNKTISIDSEHKDFIKSKSNFSAWVDQKIREEQVKGDHNENEKECIN